MTAIVPIIGGGPAGMSCALWLSNYGLRPIIIEREAALGGMARRNPYPNPWLLGRPGATGRASAEAFARHVEQAGVDCWLGAAPVRIDRYADGSFECDVAFSDGRAARSLRTSALVLATGTAFRGAQWLDRVKNARRLEALGRVHVGAPWAGEPHADLGSHVAIIGGGDNAFDVAHILTGKGLKATIVMRTSKPLGQRLLIERIEADVTAGMAQVVVGRTVEALEDADGKVGLRLDDRSALTADHVVLLFGYQPNADMPWLAELALARDPNGYLTVDGNMETSRRGVFAVGDVSNPAHPCIATALASGTVAARELQKRLARTPMDKPRPS